MTYLIIADWDVNNNPTRINNKATEAEAITLVDKLINELGVTGAFYVADPQVEMQYIVVDGVNKTITVDTALEKATQLANQWAVIRAQRDALLSSCDWRAMPDAPTMSADWTNYRQALRNLPSTEADPDNVVFPEEPL